MPIKNRLPQKSFWIQVNPRFPDTFFLLISTPQVLTPVNPIEWGFSHCAALKWYSNALETNWLFWSVQELTLGHKSGWGVGVLDANLFKTT